MNLETTTVDKQILADAIKESVAELNRLIKLAATNDMWIAAGLSPVEHPSALNGVYVVVNVTVYQRL